MKHFNLTDKSWWLTIHIEEDCPAETKKLLYEMVESALNVLSTLNTENANSGQNGSANSGNAM